MLTRIERGADMLLNPGHIGPEMAQALKAEAVRRHAQQARFGHIAFASLLGRKPGADYDAKPLRV